MIAGCPITLKLKAMCGNWPCVLALGSMPAILGPALDNDTREAFLFESDDEQLYGVALDKEGTLLPGGHGWKFLQQFCLGLHEAMPVPIDPEPVLRGIAAEGCFTWRRDRTHPFGTAQ